MKLSIIIPVYNEEQTIGTVVERVRAVDLGAIEKEIIIANDGSDDGTQRAIEAVRSGGGARVHNQRGTGTRKGVGRDGQPITGCDSMVSGNQGALEKSYRVR